MVATFVVEDGTGLTTANSYTTVAFADQYHEDYGNPASWSALLLADKEAALRVATRYLDDVYGLRWVGIRATQEQALDWPRVAALDADQYAVDPDSVPIEVQQATAIMALKHVEEGAAGTVLEPDIAAGSGGLKRERVKAGPVEQDREWLGAKQDYKIYTVVSRLLLTLLRSRQILERA